MKSDGAPIGPGGRKLRGLIIDYANTAPPAALLVIMQDTDGDKALMKNAHRVATWARSRDDLPACVIGTPHKDAEAWFLAIPALDEDEQHRKV